MFKNSALFLFLSYSVFALKFCCSFLEQSFWHSLASMILINDMILMLRIKSARVFFICFVLTHIIKLISTTLKNHVRAETDLNFNRWIYKITVSSSVQSSRLERICK